MFEEPDEVSKLRKAIVLFYSEGLLGVPLLVNLEF
jgi:hypothetical protein